MKYIKTYENIHPHPNKYDYVIVNFRQTLDVAQITSIVISEQNPFSAFIVEFNDNTGRTYVYNIRELLYWSDNYNDCLEMIPIILNSTKYNI
jgi:hypothetical protein